MTENKQPAIIGRAEKVFFVDVSKQPIPAKVDTGADLSSIWATDIHVEDDKLSFKLFGPSSEFYTGKAIVLAKKDYSVTRVANSFGHREVRYVVKLRIRIAGRLVQGTFTLSNRASKLYPILLGRRLLKGKFVVDVAQGDPLHEAEKARRQKLQVDLDKLNSDKLK
jgi:hypothetical protein